MYTQKEREFFAPLERECFGDIADEDYRRLNAQFASLDAIPNIPKAPPVSPVEYNSSPAYGYSYLRWGFPSYWAYPAFVQMGTWLMADHLRIILIAAGVLLGVVFSIHP